MQYVWSSSFGKLQKIPLFLAAMDRSDVGDVVRKQLSSIPGYVGTCHLGLFHYGELFIVQQKNKAEGKPKSRSLAVTTARISRNG